jgi:hypothetical protein
VTEGNRVVGIVSRADLLRALMVAVRSEPLPTPDDRSLRAAVLAALDNQSWTPMTTLNVTAQDGIVDLWGNILNEGERRAICILAENTPGVKKVNDHLVFVEPYSGTVITGSAERQ